MKLYEQYLQELPVTTITIGALIATALVVKSFDKCKKSCLVSTVKEKTFKKNYKKCVQKCINARAKERIIKLKKAMRFCKDVYNTKTCEKALQKMIDKEKSNIKPV